MEQRKATDREAGVKTLGRSIVGILCVCFPLHCRLPNLTAITAEVSHYKRSLFLRTAAERHTPPFLIPCFMRPWGR